MRRSSFMDKNTYPETFIICGETFNGRRESNVIMIPYTQEPKVKIGDVLNQISGTSEIEFQVMDFQFGENQSLKVGTQHPHKLKLIVKNITADKFQPKQNSSSFSIGTLNGNNVQLGDGNTQNFINIIEQIKDKIDNSDATPEEKEEAKGLLWQLMDNKLVNTVVGTLASNALKSE